MGVRFGDIDRDAEVPSAADIAGLATRDDVAKLATKDDIAGLATKADIAALKALIESANAALAEAL